MALILSDLTIPIKLISLYDTRLFVVGLFSLSDKNITIAEKSPLVTTGSSGNWSSSATTTKMVGPEPTLCTQQHSHTSLSTPLHPFTPHRHWEDWSGGRGGQRKDRFLADNCWLAHQGRWLTSAPLVGGGCAGSGPRSSSTGSGTRQTPENKILRSPAVGQCRGEEGEGTEGGGGIYEIGPVLAAIKRSDHLSRK